MFERKMVVFVAVRGERKGGKRKSLFFFKKKFNQYYFKGKYSLDMLQ